MLIILHHARTLNTENPNPSPTPKNQSHKKNITLKQRLQFYIINKESECDSDSDNESESTNWGHEQRPWQCSHGWEEAWQAMKLCNQRHQSHTQSSLLHCSSFSFFFLSFFQIFLLIAFWFWILVLDIELIGFAFYRKNIMSSSSISSELVKYSNAK